MTNEKQSDKRNDFGRHCEFMARTYLEQQGYLILETNWRSGHKEIDIIAKEGEMLVIVEVKARKNEDFMFAEDAVDDLERDAKDAADSMRNAEDGNNGEGPSNRDKNNKESNVGQ